VEATATGNLIAQLIALGELSGLKEGRELVKRSFPINEYTPENKEQWDEAYERLLKIIGANNK